MNRDLYTKIAFLYYQMHLTQDEIAKRLNLTRQKVNQIIGSLQEMGIVSIHIQGFESEAIAFESRFEQAFGLNEVLIVSDGGSEEFNLQKVVVTAAQHLDRTIRNGDIIGVSWGQTLTDVVSYMAYQRKNKCRVMQLIGAQNITDAGMRTDEIARELANHLNCSATMLHAPVTLEHEETKKWLMKEKAIQYSFDQIRLCNVALVGVGDLNKDSTMFKIGYIEEADMLRLRKDGFCSDVCMNPIRLDGSYEDCYYKDRLMNADIDTLKNIENVIAVACGVEKAEAVLAALRTGCINSLVIDEPMAVKIAELSGVEI